MRVLMFAGYNHPAQHRKVEILADADDIELVHVVGPHSGRAPGRQPSANGARTYTLRLAPKVYSLGRPDDPHRIFGWPPRYGIASFKPHLIHYEGEVESLGAAEIVLLKRTLAPRAVLVLTSWQNIVRPRSWAVRLVNAFNMKAAQHVLCASVEAMGVLQRQGYHGGTSVCSIMGLDTRYFHPKLVQGLRAQLGLHGFAVGYVGRLVPEKGVDTLLIAVAQTPLPLHILVIGNGPERDRLQAMAQQLGLAERCHFVEAVPYDIMADYMNALDMLVLPSRTTVHWKEQYGRVLIEAMGCKVVVAGSDSGAIAEVIGDPDRIFPEGDAQALARIIQRLASDDTLRRTLTEQDRQRAVKHYSVEQLASKTLEVWRDLNARHHSTR